MTTLTMVRGTSCEILIPVRDQDGAPLDLTNGTARFWVGKSVNSKGSDVVIKKDTVDGITITSDGATPPLFTLVVILAPIDTEAVEPRDSYYYEVETTDNAGFVYVVAGDVFQLKASLTT